MREKIASTIESAINHLENSVKALVKKDEEGAVSTVWRAASDLEYALFLFSITHQEEFKSPSQKLDLDSRQVDIGPALILAQDLLREAKGSVVVGELHEARRKTWLARGHILRLQETFEKRRRV